jgi:glucose-fructose oxidoreductase
MIAYRVRYEPFNSTAIELARSERYAPVRMVNGEIAFTMNNNGNTWRSDPSLNGGGGPLMDLGIYTVNAQRYITGEEPATVTAQTYRPGDDPRFPKGVESRCHWSFTFPSGATGSGATAWDCGGVNRYRVTGPNGWFELDPATPYGGNRLIHGEGRRLADITPQNQFANELDHMAQCVLDDQTPLTPGEEGRADVVAMKAIYQAAAEGRAVAVR